MISIIKFWQFPTSKYQNHFWENLQETDRKITQNSILHLFPIPAKSKKQISRRAKNFICLYRLQDKISFFHVPKNVHCESSYLDQILEAWKAILVLEIHGTKIKILMIRILYF